MPSAGDLLLPSPAVGQTQAVLMGSEAMSSKKKRIKKELKLTLSDALTIPGPLALLDGSAITIHISHSWASLSILLQRLPRIKVLVSKKPEQLLRCLSARLA